MKRVMIGLLFVILLTTIICIASAEIINLDLATASDEELLTAINAIKAEQRARIKTKIQLDNTEAALFVGKSLTLKAQVVELPEGEKSPKLNWSTSDKTVATCQNGTIRAVNAGTTTITCSATLADGTYIYEDCLIQVKIPVASISTKKQSINIGGGEVFSPEFTIQPQNASNSNLSFESSNESVATVDNAGNITGTGSGTAKITVMAADGSGKKTVINVKVTDKRIAIEDAIRVALTVITNDRAGDIFTPDGNDFDKKKFHDYLDFGKELKIINEGEWTTPNGGNSWHVEGLIIQYKVYKGYFKYTMDITYDGKNYHAENAFYVSAAQQQYLNEADPSKYGKEIISNPDFYTYLTVTPKQIGK